jgi:hypothetical protein
VRPKADHTERLFVEENKITEKSTCPKCGTVCALDDIYLARTCPYGHEWIGLEECRAPAPECGSPLSPQPIATVNP